ncbi:MarR family winged helix-turn-helix transcriptional regulator [Tepidamorphus sp. 3E244]|uniref:MarR family winged helix-turn-helix transcriptional regulator n=1 Tax=Tepidamorphus sp. 3E244 TaxID=3385498 RepID=UPI0038FD126B
MGKVEDAIDNISRNWPQIGNESGVFSFVVQYIAAQLNASAREALKPFDLSFTAFEVLCALRISDEHALLPTDLYDRVLLSSGGLTKVLKAMEARDLIARPQAQDDARRKPVVLTDHGRKLVEQAMTAVQSAEKRLLVEQSWTGKPLGDLNAELLKASRLFEER